MFKRIISMMMVYALFVYPLFAGFVIKDGRGTGNTVQVDSKNRLRTHAVVQSELESASEEGDAYSWTTEVEDYSAGDTILLIKNTSSDQSLHIEKVFISASTNTAVVFHSPNVTTPAGNVVTGVNLNRTSAKSADADARGKETSNAQLNVIWTGFAEDNEFEEVNMQGAVILGQNQSFAVDFSSRDANGNARSVITVFGHFE